MTSRPGFPMKARARRRLGSALTAAALVFCACEDTGLEPEEGGNPDPVSPPIAMAVIPGAGVDDDGVDDAVDNCPTTYNPEQTDGDGDGIGDACEVVRSGSLTVTTQAAVDALAGVTDWNQGRLTIQGPAIEDLSPLSSLTEVWDLDLIGVTADLMPLQNLRRIEQRLVIQGGTATSPNLAELSGLRVLLSAFLASENVQSVDGLSGLVAARDITLASNALTSVQGLATTSLQRLTLYSSSLTDLSGIPTAVEYLVLGRTPVTDLSSLPALDRLTSLELRQLPQLESFIGLQGSPVSVVLRNLPTLTSLAGIPTQGLRSLAAAGVPTLADLQALSGIEYLDILQLESAPALESLQWLEGLQSVGDLRLLGTGVSSLQALGGLNGSVLNLLLEDNPVLTDLRGLEGVSGISGTLRIQNNGSLTSLDGLEGITSLGTFSFVTSNPELADCSALAPLLEAGAEVDIGLNAPGCNSVEEILAGPVIDISGLTDPIVFASARDGGSQIYAVAADGTGTMPLTADEGGYGPALSPDRNRVAFTTGRDGNAEIYVLSLADGVLTNLTQSPSNDFFPAWSPDGTRIAFQSNRDGDYDLYTMNPDGSGVVQVTDLSGAENHPSWSPDGTRIAFQSEATGWTELFVADADGTGVQQVTSFGASAQRPEWSPDGTRIAFSSNHEAVTNQEIYIIGVDGAGLTRLTNHSSDDRAPSWFSDATRIVFQSQRSGGTYQLYSVSADGTGLQRITTSSGTDYDPDWRYASDAPPVIPDSDGDGVPDTEDICPGFDDNLDADGDGIPNGCDPIYNGAPTFTTQAELDELAGVTRFTGNVTLRSAAITDLAPLSSVTRMDGDLFLYEAGVSDLTPLANLARIEKSLRLQGNANLTSLAGLDPGLYIKALHLQSNPSLTNLDGFPDITSMFGIALINNPALRDTDGLDGLARLDGYLLIQGSPLVTSLSGLTELSSVGQTLTIAYMDGLTDLTGLESLTTADLSISNNNSLETLSPMGPLTSSRQVELANNPVLADVSALSGITGLTRTLIIRNNDALTDLTPLSTLSSVGQDFLISQNDALPTLAGLENLTSVGNRLYLQDNTTLAVCSAIAQLLQSGVGGEIFISGNGSGCASLDEILDRDGDGVPDVNDAFPDDPSEWADTDGDGVGDNADVNPTDPSGGTPTGTDVSVSPNDQNGDPAPVGIVFDEVTGVGETSVVSGTVGDGGAPAPNQSDFKLGQPPTYYDVTTTATFSGTAQLCIDYSSVSFGSLDQLRLLHFSNGAWVDITDPGYPDTATSTICGTTTSFSPFLVAETNLAPSVTSLTLPVDPVQVGTSVGISAAFSDENTLDLHTAEIDWGVATTSGTISETGGSGIVSGSFVFNEPGVYQVTVRVSDGGLTGQRSSTLEEPSYVVVYDPSAGFVTGGGWIDSPTGACAWTGCAGDGSTAGKATFGFVSRYVSGRNTPDGNTAFSFKAGNLDFKSVSYEWLVVAGNRGQFKGQGSVNGQTGYGFILTAIDEGEGNTSADAFRIKIWDRATDTVIYDNRMGEDETGPAATQLGGGSIIIHSR